MDIDNDDNPTPNQSDFPKPLASFHLIKKETEAYLPIASLIWPAPGTHFVAGTINRIDIFDVSRPDISLSTQPFHTIPTIPSTRFLTKGGGVGMRGTVSALDAHPGVSEGWGFIAAGTWTRNLGLYDLSQAGQCVATWSVAPASGEQGIGGNGIVQVMWSPCGRYLVVNERRSTGLLVYDIRGTHQLLACLKGRDAQTNQRLSCDVFPGTGKVGGFEVWAGTKNGGVVVWEGIGNQEGSIEPSWDWEAHQAAVGSTALHMSGSVVATCSGSWEFVDEDESSESESIDSSDSSSSSSDSEDAEQNSGKRVLTSRTRIVVPETSLKVWSIGSNTPPETDEGQTS
ncbi:putative nucleotide-binding protein [Thermochaetoides thermophila DSM 1495]|uniref:Putative nucleotide-binding protein n=1 Tax=Chaetomium thermophilum (strain DSM 1495 / CBS 144.50 / IMI 039719) TaxID=759272 RepID=G0S7E5_CHATD|nr:putative nucleotide-binding protein [Thermochaetoides thermophila DSM 1495]EGS21789.1 putative nucleotide-binding protein [Thermochaetoides thermophila DSM 1495]